LGLFLPALLFAPESPWWAIRRGKKDLAKQQMRRLYSNVPSYDVEKEYLVLEALIAGEDGATAASNWKQYAECFKGSNW
jgi:SP family general alpha glucoside:H+ symporter-like MFS transporter